VNHWNLNQVTKMVRGFCCRLVQRTGRLQRESQSLPTSSGVDPSSVDSAQDGERWRFAQQMEREFWLNLNAAEFVAQEAGYKTLAGHLVRHAQAHFGERDDIRVLQIGCAVEDAIMHFPYGKRFAIDPLADFYIRHFERARNPGVAYFTAKGEAIPFTADLFDLVICNNVLDHVFEPQKLLYEVRRTLRTGGLFFLSVDVYSTDTRAQRVAKEAAWEVVDPCHPHTFTHEILRNLVEGIGFQVLTAEDSDSGKGDDSVRFELTILNVKKDV
jgi:SAM-dependent methyltransferase